MSKYNLIILKNQGFCFGVTTAIAKVLEEAKNLPKPIYLLGDLVHNKYVSDQLAKAGIIILRNKTRLAMLDEIDSGSVIISAHGVNPQVYQKINDLHLRFLDTTCPFVEKSAKLIHQYINNGYDVVYIGKIGHPETEGVQSIEHVHVIENQKDIDMLNLSNDKIAVANQTTLSVLDIEYLINLLKLKYPSLTIINSVCNSTSKRQMELITTIESLNEESAMVIVIGDQMSNNTKSLALRASHYPNVTVLQVENKQDIVNNLSLITSFKNIIISSGASTPSFIIDEIIAEVNNILNK